MAQSQLMLSAFGDEIADDLDDQLDLLKMIKVRYLELRGVWGKNVLDLTQQETDRIAAACRAFGIQVSAIGSPIGKSPISDPIDREIAHLRRIADTAERVDCRLVRVFSFYPPEDSADSNESLVDLTVERLHSLLDVAAEYDLMLILENEKGIVGDTVEQCRRILSAIDSPRLKFAWDPANFVQVGHRTPTDDGWSSLGKYVAHVHIKDVDANTREVTPAGAGNGQIAELLQKLHDSEYVGFLALEPHLAIAGHSSGFSGPDGMRRAAEALRQVMATIGCKEA